MAELRGLGKIRWPGPCTSYVFYILSQGLRNASQGSHKRVSDDLSNESHDHIMDSTKQVAGGMIMKKEKAVITKTV